MLMARRALNICPVYGCNELAADLRSARKQGGMHDATMLWTVQLQR
jgi:hypothetical protein